MAGAGRNWTIAVTAFVSFDVKAQAAARTNSISLKGLHRECFMQGGVDPTLRQLYRCGNCSEIVSKELGNRLSGYTLGKGQYVPLTEDEVKAQVSAASDVMTVTALIPADQVPPIMRDKSYYLGPQEPPKVVRGVPQITPQMKAFELFRTYLAQQDRVAIVTYTEAGHDKIAAIFPGDNHLMLWELFFADEIAGVEESFKPGTFTPVGLQPKEIEVGALVFGGLSADTVDWTAYADGYVERVTKLALAKAEGKEIPVIERTEAPTPQTDLLAALQASLAAQQGASKPPAAVEPKPKAEKKARKSA